MNRKNLENLSQFTGTENYYPYNFGIMLTDGIKYLADNADCYWLLDIVASYQFNKELENAPFQIWELKAKNEKGIVTCKEDSNMPEIVKQKIPYTDFPLAKIKLYLIDGVLMLPSEY